MYINVSQYQILHEVSNVEKSGAGHASISQMQLNFIMAGAVLIPPALIRRDKIKSRRSNLARDTQHTEILANDLVTYANPKIGTGIPKYAGLGLPRNVGIT